MQVLGAGDPRRIGPYVLTGRLGAGGMGSVYLGWDPSGRPAAVKVVRPDFLQDPDFRARFRREISSARRVSGPWISRVLDADPDAESPWLATEYVAGPTLDTAVNRFGPLPSQTVAVLAQCLGQALSAVHAAGVVHRDIKPNNILLAADGPRLIDFGIARATDDTKLTATHAGVLGVAGFIAPERIERQAMLPAGDVFAGGVVLAFAATGRLAFGGGEPVTVAYRVVHGEPDLTELPEELRPLVTQCLSKDPQQRPDAGRLAAEAERLRGASDWPGVPLTNTDYSSSGISGDTLELATSWLPRPLAMHTVRDYDLSAAHAAAETARLDLRHDARFGGEGAGWGGAGASAGAAGGFGPGAGAAGSGGLAGAGSGGGFVSGGGSAGGFSRGAGSAGGFDSGGGFNSGAGAPGSGSGFDSGGGAPRPGGAVGFGADIGPVREASALTGNALNAAGFSDMSGGRGPHTPRPRSGDTEQLPPQGKKPVALVVGGAVAAVALVAGGVAVAFGGGTSNANTPQANGSTQPVTQSVSGKDGGDLPGGADSKPGDSLQTSNGAPPASGSSSTSSSAAGAPASTAQAPSTSAGGHTSSAAPPSSPSSHGTTQAPPSQSKPAPPPPTSQAPAPAPVPCGGTTSTPQGTGINCPFDTAGNGYSGGSPVLDSGGSTLGYLPEGTNWVICQAQGPLRDRERRPVLQQLVGLDRGQQPEVGMGQRRRRTRRRQQRRVRQRSDVQRGARRAASVGGHPTTRPADRSHRPLLSVMECSR